MKNPHATNADVCRILIGKYRSISVGQILDVEEDQRTNTDGTFSGGEYAAAMTGLGSQYTCILCAEVRDKSAGEFHCNLCVHGSNFACIHDAAIETYEAIGEATTPEALVAAFKARANYLESLL